MSNRYEHRYKADGTYIVWDTKTHRAVSPQQIEYLAYLANGGEVTSVAYTPPPEPALSEVKDAKLRELADARWREETGGFTLALESSVGDLVIATDDRSKALLTGAFLLAQANNEFTTVCKDRNNQFVTVSAAQIIGAFTAMSAWIEELFQKERTLGAQAADAESVEEVNAITWEGVE
jgi:hypothetical protein